MADEEPDVLSAEMLRALERSVLEPPWMMMMSPDEMILIHGKRYIERALQADVFFERDGQIFDRITGARVIEHPPMPAPLKNYPPKPERAFWRGAPRRKR